MDAAFSFAFRHCVCYGYHLGYYLGYQKCHHHVRITVTDKAIIKMEYLHTRKTNKTKKKPTKTWHVKDCDYRNDD